MEILDHDFVEGLPSGMLETLKKSARHQQQRQIRRIEMLKKQASLANEQQFLWAQKQHAELMRMQQLEAETLKRKEIESFNRKVIALKREAALQSSQKDYGAKRQALLKKLQEADRRANQKELEKTRMLETTKQRAIEAEKRREKVKQACEEIVEIRHQEHARSVEKLEEIAQRNEEARKLDAELRQFHEEAKRKHREDVAYRRDAELQMKTVKFAQQQQQKEELLEQRKQDQETIHQMKCECSMRRHDTISSKVFQQTQRDEIQRVHRMQKIQDKMDRADQLQLQKSRFLQALQEIRKDMSTQEAMIKEKLNKMETTGRFDGLADLDIYSTIGGHGTSTSFTPRTRPKSAHPTMQRDTARYRPTIQQSMSMPMAGMDIERQAYNNNDALDGLLDPEDNNTAHKGERLRAALKREVHKEIERQNRLAKVQDPLEFQQLQKLFTIERKESMDRINALRG